MICWYCVSTSPYDLVGQSDCRLSRESAAVQHRFGGIRQEGLRKVEHRFAPFDTAPKRVVNAGRPAAKYRLVAKAKVRQAVSGQAGGEFGQQRVIP
jgi:hypothetical protein